MHIHKGLKFFYVFSPTSSCPSQPSRGSTSVRI
jgi:hypothetical protein